MGASQPELTKREKYLLEQFDVLIAERDALYSLLNKNQAVMGIISKYREMLPDMSHALYCLKVNAPWSQVNYCGVLDFINELLTS